VIVRHKLGCRIFFIVACTDNWSRGRLGFGVMFSDHNDSTTKRFLAVASIVDLMKLMETAVVVESYYSIGTAL
jgi:hypothetical protein